MISPMLSLFMLLPTSIIVNSTTPNCRQKPFFCCFRNKNRGTSKSNYFRLNFASACSSNSDTKEHVVDMPFPLNYGSTGRPPGEYHLRHSFKEITDNLEFPPPPFDIFFIELNNRNNNNHSIIYYNGGIVDDDKDKDIKDGGPYGTRRIGTAVALDLDNWSLNQMTSNNNNSNNNNSNNFHFYNRYNRSELILNNNNNNNSIEPDTTPINHNTSTYDDNNKANIAHRIHRTDKRKWYDISNNNNSNSKSISLSTRNTSTTSTTTTINYNTSTYNDNNKANIAHRIHRKDKIKWSNNNNKSNSTYSSTTSIINNDNSNTYNDNETFHFPYIFKLISLYLILTKSSPPKDSKTAPIEKHPHQQQHYHGKYRYQFHQYFKQQHHNVERMAASIVLKLTLVAWDMWTYRNGF